jgi:hypothetical protein
MLAPNPSHRPLFVQTDIVGPKTARNAATKPVSFPWTAHCSPNRSQIWGAFGVKHDTDNVLSSPPGLPGSDHLALPSHPDDFLFLLGTTAGPPRLYCPPFRGKKSLTANARLPPSILLRMQAVPVISPSSASFSFPGITTLSWTRLRPRRASPMRLRPQRAHPRPR